MKVKVKVEFILDDYMGGSFDINTTYQKLTDIRLQAGLTLPYISNIGSYTIINPPIISVEEVYAP